MLIKEFDALSQNVKTEIINVTENNFAKVTADNIVRALYVLAEASTYGYDKVQIAQAEIAMHLKLSENRISELLKLAKKAGLIGINMICRCGNIRNEYTLLNNPVIKSIKNVVFKSQEPDSKESIDIAIEDAMNLYRAEGEPEHILEAAKRKIQRYKIQKASGVANYFPLVLISIKKSIKKSKPSPIYENSKKGTWNNYEQRPYDPSIEKQLLESNVEKEDTVDVQSFLKEFRE